MDFTIPPDLQDLQHRTRAFIRDKVIPFEADPRQERHGPTDGLRRELNALARAAGLLAPHVAPEYGGLGLSHVGTRHRVRGSRLLRPRPPRHEPLRPGRGQHAPAGGRRHRGAKGPLAAPPRLRRHPLLLLHDRAAARRRLRPRRPPHHRHPRRRPATSSRARKWFTTGAAGAGFAIIMAKGARRPRHHVPRRHGPARHPRRPHSWTALDQGFAGGHAVVEIEGLRVPASDVLGEVGEGFRYAQVRLAPARLTHCMRWLGAARRAQDIAVAYAAKREAFGKPLAQHEGIGFMLADNDMDIRTSRLTIWHTAWLLDQGEPRRHGKQHRQGRVQRGHLARRRPLRPGPRRHRRHRRDPGRAHLPRGPRLPHLRRRQRGPPLEPGPKDRQARREPLDPPCATAAPAEPPLDDACPPQPDRQGSGP